MAGTTSKVPSPPKSSDARHVASDGHGPMLRCPKCAVRLALKVTPAPGVRVRCSACKTEFDPRPQIDAAAAKTKPIPTVASIAPAEAPYVAPQSLQEKDPSDFGTESLAIEPRNGDGANTDADGVDDSADRRIRVFVSHSTEDRIFVEGFLQTAFRQYDIDTWISGCNLEVGDAYAAEIERALSRCDWIVIVASPRSAASTWVRHEAAYAMSSRPDRVIPIMLERCDPRSIHPDLLRVQYIEFGDHNHTAAFTRVVRSMLRRTNHERIEHRRKADDLQRQLKTSEHRRDRFQTAHEEAQTRIRRALEFNGTWAGPKRGRVREFLPLDERRTPIVSVFNLKGGVGKSTLTANIAATFWGSKFKKRVLVVDADYQGSLTRQCLAANRIAALRHGRNMTDRFLDTPVESNLLEVLAESVQDDRAPDNQGMIIATDEELQIAETRSMVRWLVGSPDDDVRYQMRTALHRADLSELHDLVLIDCPPRLTTATMNALLASDFVLIPTILDETSVEAVPRLLNWLSVHREDLFQDLDLLGVVCNKTKNPTVIREREVKDQLQASVEDAWGVGAVVFDTDIPKFNEGPLSYDIPAHHRDVRERFEGLAGEIWKSIPR